MSDSVEKIYCCDRGGFGNDGFAAAAMLNGGMGGGNWQNNPFIYLVWMMFANRMWGNDWGGNGNSVQTAEIQAQLNSLRTQMSDNQNATLVMDGIKGVTSSIQQLAQNLNCDFNTLNACCCDVRNGIGKLSGEIGFSAERIINAANMGDCNIIQALKDCCCATQKEILRLGSDIQLQTCQQTHTLRDGQRDLGVAMSEGFSKLGFQMQSDKCEIIRAGQDNTQRIIDTLNSHWKEELAKENQDLKFQLSQERQTRMIERMGRGNWGRDRDCGCNDGCGF